MTETASDWGQVCVDMPKVTLRAILKQAGIDPEVFLAGKQAGWKTINGI